MNNRVMSRSAGLYRSKLAIATPAAFLKAAIDTSALWSKAVLSAPFPDLAGDIVRPDGIDWTDHQADPSIDLEHGRHPEVRGMPVAWARESLSEPGGRYAVEHKSLNFGTDDAPDVHSVPIGTSYFDPACKVSMQCFALVEQDVLPAVSLEFSMIPGFHKSLGRSPLEPRDAMDFGRTRAKRWALTGRGVCPHALTLRKSLPASVTQVPQQLTMLLRDKRVLVGANWEPLHGHILKALLPYQEPTRKSRVIVRVEKSMADDPDADLETADDTDAGASGPAVNGITAHYDAAQKLIDACEQFRAAMEGTDSPDLYREAMKHCDMLEAAAEKIKATGDKHDAKLQAMKGGQEAPAETDDEPADISTDDDGVMKAVREPYRPILKALRVKRFSLADIAVEPVVKAAPEVAAEASPELLAALAENLKWKKHAG